MSTDYKRYAGDDLQIEVTVLTDDEEPAYLLGAQAVYVIARGGSVKVRKTSAEGDITVTGAQNNVFTIDLSAADTVALSGVYRHELKYISAVDDKTYTPVYGDVEFLPTAIGEVAHE